MDKFLVALERYRVPLVPLHPVVSILPGEWDSVYHGEGFDIDSLRDYRIGDNIRRVNPRISAKRGVQTIVDRVTLRDLTVVIYGDATASMRLRSKKVIQINAAATLLFSAYKHESSFELAFLGDWKNHLNPRRGEQQFLSLYRRLGSGQDKKSSKQDFLLALYQHLHRTIEPHSIVFVISDFLGLYVSGDEREKVLKQLAHRYDIIPVIVQDDLEYTFPVFDFPISFVLYDEEAERQRELWLTPEDQREIKTANEKRFTELQAAFRNAGIESIHIDDYSLGGLFGVFSNFFLSRKTRQRLHSG
ncbi:MAG: DUF58 domain-containing protein [Candidatus Spechtbacteria bacterium]|nr:DUF58 domain-containing protein [Candidatus Spechtbacteria bacterium]